MPIYWNDSRVIVNGSDIDNTGTGRWYHVNPNLKDDIWFPNFFIRNMQEFETINTIATNEKLMITTNPNQRFYYAAFHLIKFTCELRFGSFPFDEHSCYFEVRN